MAELDILESPRKEITYYQWVPLVLFLQAFMFYLPCVHWYIFNRAIGMDINKVVSVLRQLEHINPESRDKCTKYLVKHIDRSLNYTKEIRRGTCANIKRRLAECGLICGKRHGNFLMTVYMITKLLYLGDTILQLYMMNHFLGTDYTFYGIDVLRDLREKGEYKESRRFPRVTLCDFLVRSLGRSQPHTVQCTLPINLFNEKIFLFTWFWLALMLLLNFTGTIYWMWIVFTTNRRAFVKTYLKVFGKFEPEKDQSKLNAFSDRYLRQDGHFLLRIIGKNTNEVVVGELVTALWENFCSSYDHRKRKQYV